MHFLIFYFTGSPFVFKVVESERDIRNLDTESQIDAKNKKERFNPVKEIQRNHISLEGHSLGQMKTTENHTHSKFSDKFQTEANIFSKSDTTRHSSNVSENKTSIGNVSNQENLSFSQRAELVNSKLMAHKDDFKRNKAPAPPTPKKPANTEATVNSWNSNTNEKQSEVFKSKSIQENSHFSSDQHLSSHSLHHMSSSENIDGLGAKPKVFLKKVKDNKGSDNSFMHSSSKYDMNEFSPFSSSKYKKETVDISEVIPEGEGLKLVHVKQPTTFSLHAPWLKQDDIQVTVTGNLTLNI